MRICADCDTDIHDPRARYCSHCGARVVLASDRPLRPDRFASPAPGPASDDDTVTQIRHATVLYADLVRSTEMVALLDAEDAMNRLQPILATMCEIVEESGGAVLSTMGDGVVALFGALRTDEYHAELACHASLQLRERIKLQGSDLSVRSGLHSGEIVVHHRISDPAGTLRAYGVMLHLASRLPAVVAPDEICLTDACRGLIRQGFKSRAFGSHALRGVPQQVKLFLLDSIGLTDAERGGDGTPFLNRARELAALAESLDRATAGEGETLCLLGVPGTGKSRLCTEFALACGRRDVPVSRVAIQPHGVHSPLRSLGLLLKDAYFSVGTTEPDAATVSALLAATGEVLPGDLALICGLLGIPVAERSHLLTPTARVARLVEIVGRFIRRPAAAPRVLIVDDVHWIDEPGRLLLAGLIRAVGGTRTLLLLNSRPTEIVSWLQQIGQTLELNDLSFDDSCSLVAHLLGPAAELHAVREQVVARSAGNPFFAEELVRSLADDGVVVGTAGAYASGSTVGPSALPLTVQAVIGSRIDHLPRPERELLQLSAVVGKEFHVDLLRIVFRVAHGDPVGRLHHLQAVGLVRERDGANSGRFEFRHPLIQEVAYNMQLKERRSHLHAEVARAMRELYPDCDGDMAGVIAVHLEEAGQYEEAAAFAAQAARWVGQHSSGAAMERWHKVRALLGRVGQPGDSGALGIEANGQVAWLGWREGHTAAQAEPFLQEALGSAAATGHPMTSLLMLARGRIAQVSGGDSDVFVRTLTEAAALAQAQGDRGRIATLQASLSHAYGWAGLLNHALAANDAALADAHLVQDADQQFLGYDVRDWALSLRGRILLRLGLISPARQCFDLMIGRKGSIDPTVTFVGHFGYVELAQSACDETMAAEHAEQIDVLARRHGSAYLTFYAAVARALADGVAGRLDAAIHHTRSCLDLQRRSGAAVEFEPELLANLADYQKRAGAFAEAIATAADAATLDSERSARLPLLRALVTQAEAAILTGRAQADRPAIDDALSRASALLTQTGARLYQPLFERAESLLLGRTSTVNSGSP